MGTKPNERGARRKEPEMKINPKDESVARRLRQIAGKPSACLADIEALLCGLLMHGEPPEITDRELLVAHLAAGLVLAVHKGFVDRDAHGHALMYEVLTQDGRWHDERRQVSRTAGGWFALIREAEALAARAGICPSGDAPWLPDAEETE
jgi:hypothetical protein